MRRLVPGHRPWLSAISTCDGRIYALQVITPNNLKPRAHDELACILCTSWYHDTRTQSVNIVRRDYCKFSLSLHHFGESRSCSRVYVLWNRHVNYCKYQSAACGVMHIDIRQYLWWLQQYTIVLLFFVLPYSNEMQIHTHTQS